MKSNSDLDYVQFEIRLIKNLHKVMTDVEDDIVNSHDELGFMANCKRNMALMDSLNFVIGERLFDLDKKLEEKVED